MSGADDPVVAFVLSHPGLLDRLLRQHRDRGDGYCGTCGGPQSGRHRMPCRTRVIADRARAVSDGTAALGDRPE